MTSREVKIILLTLFLVLGVFSSPSIASGKCTANPNRNTRDLLNHTCTGLGNATNGFNQGPQTVYVQPKPKYGSNGYSNGKSSNGLTKVLCKKDSFGRMVCR